MTSSAFTVDGNPISGAMATSWSTSVALAMVDTTGAHTINWSITGTSHSGITAPTISTATSPTASFTMIADPGYGVGASVIATLVVTDSAGTEYTTSAIIGVPGPGGWIPASVGETTERNSTHGTTELFNECMAAGTSASPSTPTDDGKFCWANGGSWDAADEVKTDGTYVAIGVTTPSTGDLRLDAAGTVTSLSGSGDLPVLTVGSGALTWGDNSFCVSQTARVKTSGWYDFYINNAICYKFNPNNLYLYRNGDATTYTDVVQYATGVGFFSVVSGGTPNEFLKVVAGPAVRLGDESNTATAQLRASTTLGGVIGANDAWTATAAGHTWQAGANQIAAANATTCTWGHASNVATSDISASTTLHGYVGANAAWTSTAAGHTFKVGADNSLGVASQILTHYGADTTDQTKLITGATTTTLSRITNGGTQNDYLSATATEVTLGDESNTQTIDFEAAAAAATFDWYKGVALQARLEDAGLTLFDVGDATSYVTIEHDAVLFSKGNTGGITIDFEDVTAAANGNDVLITGSGCPYGNTPGDITIQASKTATNTVSGSLLFKNGNGSTAIEINSVSASTPATIGFFGATPVSQRSDTGAITDSTGGSVDGTLAAISGSGDDANINNNFADLADWVNDIRNALRSLGLMA